MLYLSQLLGAPVEDPQGVRIGKIIDVVVPAAQVGQPEPAYARALLVEGPVNLSGAKDLWRVPIESAEWRDNILHLHVGARFIAPDRTMTQEVSLAQDVLDKQVIDIERKRAVRVNDVCLSNDWQIQGIDNSTLGLVRRLAPNWLLGTKNRHTPTNLISWSHIELISLRPGGDAGDAGASMVGVPLAGTLSRPQSGHLAELRPADIAEIVHQLTPGQGARLIEGLDDETAADAMEEIDTDRQRHILDNIQADRAADILEAMEPDEAADLLARLPEERAQQLLGLMTQEESEDVQELLEYEEHSAGGLMTTDYIMLNQAKSVSEALEAIRFNIQEQDIRSAYVYCVADETQDESPLLGVVSLWDLLIASPSQPLQELMETDLITVQPDTDPRTVAQIMAKYNLLAVPVVSEQGIMEGIVTVDDALDVLLPADRRRKPTRMY